MLLFFISKNKSKPCLSDSPLFTLASGLHRPLHCIMEHTILFFNSRDEDAPVREVRVRGQNVASHFNVFGNGKRVVSCLIEDRACPGCTIIVARSPFEDKEAVNVEATRHLGGLFGEHGHVHGDVIVFRHKSRCAGGVNTSGMYVDFCLGDLENLRASVKHAVCSR